MFQLNKRAMTCITHVSASQITSQSFALCCEINIHYFRIKDCFAESANSVCVLLINDSHLKYSVFKQKQQKIVNIK